MKKYKLIGLLLTVFIVNGFCTENLVDRIKFASLDKAKELLQQEDEFTKSWSQFDIDSRLQKPNGTRKELFNYISKQTREWNIDEQNAIQSIIASIDEQILKQGYKINFPKEIFFVKTTANEEGGADGYTRANYIVLKENVISQPEDELKKIIIHELFHILTRNNPAFRKKMYQIIGFELMNNLEYPYSLKDYRITNPDAPQMDSYIKLKMGRHTITCMMMLYSSQNYSGGEFFKYLNVGFLSLTGDSIKSIEYKENTPVIYNLRQMTGFFEQVGKNTQYIIHPEEILADNFVFAILNKSGLPNQDIVDKLKTKLKD